MVYDLTSPLDVEGPSAADLAAIEREWPLIEAEMDLVTAEIRMLTVARPSDLDWRRLRRAEARVLREAAALTAPAARNRPGRVDETTQDRCVTTNLYYRAA